MNVRRKIALLMCPEIRRDIDRLRAEVTDQRSKLARGYCAVRKLRNLCIGSAADIAFLHGFSAMLMNKAGEQELTQWVSDHLPAHRDWPNDISRPTPAREVQQ